MTKRFDQMTREQYVADAIYDAVFDGNSAPTIARIAIRANDKWLADHGWKAVPRDMTDPMRSAQYWGPVSSWQESWDRAPSPEDMGL